VRLIVPFGPGGFTDVVARLLGQKLSAALGQQFIVENKPGAGSSIGTDFVAKAAPDGYTLLMVSSTHVISPWIYQNLPYDPIKSFTPGVQAGRLGLRAAGQPQGAGAQRARSWSRWPSRRPRRCTTRRRATAARST
jgi:hypothetical protein